MTGEIFVHSFHSVGFRRIVLVLFASAATLAFLSCSGGDDDDDDSRSDDTVDDDDDLVPPGSTTTTTTTPSTTTTTSTTTGTTTTTYPTTTTSSTSTTLGSSTTSTTGTTTFPTTTTTTTSSTTTTTWPPADCYRDEDLDSRGVTGDTQTFDIGYCPLGWADRDGDFNDSEITAWTDASELPDDGIDQDGDGFDLEMSDETGVFVAKEGDDANPGTMAEPKLTVQAGVDLAETDGKAVFVAEGTYEESVIGSVSLFGGYEYPGWTRDIGANISEILTAGGAAVEITDGSVAAVEGFTLSGKFPESSDQRDSFGLTVGENAVVTAANDVISAAIIDEFPSPLLHYYGTWIDGEALVLDCSLYGGTSANNYGDTTGVRVNGRAVLVGNVIDGGLADWGLTYGVYAVGTGLTMIGNDVYGGDTAYYEAFSFGVYASGDFAAVLQDNTIDGGYALDGSTSFGSDTTIGLFIDAAAVIVNNAIDGGWAQGSVAPDTSVVKGVVLDARAPSYFVNNTVYGGQAWSYTGYDSAYAYGMETSGSVTILNNLIIAGYSNGDFSGTEALVVDGTAAVINNILDGGISNFSMDHTYVFKSALGSAVTFNNNDLYLYDTGYIDCLIYAGSYCYETLTDVNACSWSGCVSASGNIEGDPSLADEEGHLSSGSQCIDAGADASSYDPYDYADFDFEGDARPQGSACDIGADEWIL